MAKVRSKAPRSKLNRSRRNPREDVLHRLRELVKRCITYSGTTEMDQYDRLASLLQVVAQSFERTRDEMAWLFMVGTFARRRAESHALARLRDAKR